MKWLEGRNQNKQIELTQLSSFTISGCQAFPKSCYVKKHWLSSSLSTWYVFSYSQDSSCQQRNQKQEGRWVELFESKRRRSFQICYLTFPNLPSSCLFVFIWRSSKHLWSRSPTLTAEDFLSTNEGRDFVARMLAKEDYQATTRNSPHNC